MYLNTILSVSEMMMRIYDLEIQPRLVATTGPPLHLKNRPIIHTQKKNKIQGHTLARRRSLYTEHGSGSTNVHICARSYMVYREADVED